MKRCDVNSNRQIAGSRKNVLLGCVSDPIATSKLPNDGEGREMGGLEKKKESKLAKEVEVESLGETFPLF